VIREDEARRVVLRRIRELAPEVDPAAIPADAPLRDEVELDSYDFLRLVVGAAAELGVEVGEPEYPRCATLRGFVEVLVAAPPARPGAAG
jgi:acyl carrier protein